MSPSAETGRHAIRAKTAAWMIPPARGWQHKTGRMFWKPLAGALAAGGAVMVAIGALSITHQPDGHDLVIALLGSLAVIVIGMLRGIQHRLHEPLTHLRGWALRLREGDLSARIGPSEQGEFSVLASDINQLSNELQALAEDMERKVREQTVSLAQKNQSLEILYDVVANLNAVHDLEELLSRFLKTLMTVVNARAASVHLVGEDGVSRLVAAAGFATTATSGAPNGLPGTLGGEGVTIVHESAHPLFGGASVASVFVPFRHQGKTLGGYRLFMDTAELAARDDMRHLFETIGQQLGMAIEKTRLDGESRRLMLMQERQAIANDLHDSLAQSLASLRMQIAVLGETLEHGTDSVACEELQKIKRNVDGAYRELRELLVRCRAPISTLGLVPAIEDAIEYFRQNSGITVFLQNEIKDVSLDAQSEIQVLRIIQEALANIRKYSKAHHVRVLLSMDEENMCRVLVEDDGLGMHSQDTQALPGERLGLSIMQERANYLRGTLAVESEPGEGTRVMLSFPVHADRPGSDTGRLQSNPKGC